VSTRMLGRRGWGSAPAALALVALVALGCSSDRRVEERSARQRAALEAPETATLQIAAKDPIDWPKLVSKLSKDNIFRVVYRAHEKAKNRGDDGMSSLEPNEGKLLAQFTADMKEVYAIHALGGAAGPGDKERARATELQGKYASARQEVLDVLLATPELTAGGRAAVLTALSHANEARAMGLTIPVP
jgi:hypothetical protein